ncbi:MAG TPA: beta-propeller fold lactonase family protein [Gaiellaceae bacterium]
MRRYRYAAVVALVVTGVVIAAGDASASSGGSSASTVVGHLYVNDNTTGVNTVAGFDRNADGSLTPIAGSPFAVGGAGTGHATASQGSLQLSADGRYLLAVDAGSNQISVVRIQHDGSLQTTGTDVVASNGIDPVSIAVHDSLVYVANAGAAGSNYTGFTLNAGGHLRALPGSTVSLPSDAQPGDVLFNGDGTKLVGTRVGTSQIDSFTVGSDGLLTAAPGSPFAAQGSGPFGSEFRPTNSTQLFVSNAHNGGINLGTVSAFAVAADGALTSIGSSPFNDLQNAPCWVEISSDGQYLFAVNTASSSVSSYSIAAGGALTLIGSTPLAGAPAGAEDARLSPDGSTLWVVDAGADAVSGFTVNGGTLEPLSSPTPGPAGASPSGIVVT